MADENKQLIPLDKLGIKTEENKELDALTRTSDFLPQVRVYGSETNIVKEGKFPMGHFGMYFSADKIIDLGEEVDTLIVAYRARASIVTGDTPVNFYEINSKEFGEVKDKAMLGEQGYLAGLEFLIWFPNVKGFGLFLFGNKTLRRESANVRACVGAAATLKVKLIKSAKWTWHGASCFPCSNPLDLPPQESLVEEVEKFKNPKSSDVEFVNEESDTGRVV